jgi:hypothetical protein
LEDDFLQVFRYHWYLVRIIEDPALNADALLHAAPGTCPNCHAATSGNYCHECSQETTLHPPSTREFLHEFIGHYVALEGKLWKSLWLLLVRPGRLTLEYIEGRRVRYVQPLRMYLTFSIIFFALIKLSGVTMNFNEDDRVHVGKPAVHATDPAPGLKQLPSEDNESFQGLEKAARSLHPAWEPKVKSFLAQPTDVMWNQLVKAFFAYAPYALFALMPVFAFWLKVLYLGSGQRFGAHLLFALHVNAFAFAVLALQMVIPSSVGFVHALLMGWMIIYLPLALRRVYGGRWWATLLRWIVLSLLHVTCIGLAILAAAGSAVVT